MNSFTALLCLAGLIATSLGCSRPANDETVSPRLSLVDRTKSALSAANISYIAGTYGGTCEGHSLAGTDTWYTYPGGGGSLAVRKNDSDCVLTLTSIYAWNGAQYHDYIAAPPIALDTVDTYEPTASSFAPAGGALTFYGNAKIGSLTFDADFTITVLLSDVRVTDEGNVSATFGTQEATVTASNVPAPNYNFSYYTLDVVDDAHGVVQSVSGEVWVYSPSVAGQDYAIHNGALTGASTLTEIEAAWSGAAVTGLVSSLPPIPATALNLVGADLDTLTQRTIIIRNTEQGVSSYQLILLTFTP